MIIRSGEVVNKKGIVVEVSKGIRVK